MWQVSDAVTEGHLGCAEDFDSSTEFLTPTGYMQIESWAAGFSLAQS